MSSDLPSQLLLQQHAARPVSGEELETMGKYAADGFLSGRFADLNRAVVETVKTAGLSPEQVRRVVEFTNTHAFIKEFGKTAEPHKYVFFKEGLASPAEVLKDLNDGGGGTVFDSGLGDYAAPPSMAKAASARRVAGNLAALEKTAGVQLRKPDEADLLFEEAFKTAGAPGYRYENPLSDVEDVQAKLATAQAAATSELSELEVLLHDVREDLYGQVKQAAASGVPLGHVIQAWAAVLNPRAEHVKLAFEVIGPRLVEEEVLASYEALGDSLSKKASARLLANEDHPMVRTFAGFCEALDKIAHLRVTQDTLANAAAKADTFLRLADQHLEAGQ